MKLKEVIVFLQEKLFAVTKNAGKNDHTHRFDFSVREGQTSIDESHYHGYRLGDKMTRGTMRVPPNADVIDHDHELPHLPHIADSVDEDQETLSEAVNPRIVALDLVAVSKFWRGNTKIAKAAVLDTFEVMGDREKKIVNTWVTDLIGASRRAAGKTESVQEALSPALVAFDLSDVVDEAIRNKPALKAAVKTSMRSLSLKEQNVISNWVAALVDLVTPKG